MVVLEPSCCSVFRDELAELMPERNEAKNLRAQTHTLSEFLAANVDLARIPKLRRKALAQTHCHHHAVMGFDAEKKVFEAMGLEVEVLASGCCGMAGSFGFETDKFEVSQACGERVLLPRVREAPPDTLLLADGFSCKTQIAQNTPRRALHLAEALAMAIEHGARGAPSTPFVESSWVTPLRSGTQGGSVRAAATVALFAACLMVVIAVAVLAVLAGLHA
jgi:Fe-S oxidoreductase